MPDRVAKVHDLLNHGRMEDAVIAAADVFDDAEHSMRVLAKKYHDSSIFILLALILAFAVCIKITPLLSESMQHTFSFIVYYGFFVGLFFLPFFEYFIPRCITVSYLFRKQFFLHQFMDRYALDMDKPKLIGGVASVPVFFKWGKIPLGDAFIARCFNLILWFFKVQDPLHEITYAKKH